MAPVKLFNHAPITAAKPDGVTPKTATPDDGTNDNEAPHSTSNNQGLPQYVPAHPTPTRTTNTGNYGPPPPQPGAVPRLPTATTTGLLPPPPRASDTSQNQAPFPGITQPPQMSIPQPATPYGQRGTMPATGPNFTHPQGYQQVDYGRQAGPAQSDNLSHPPGYQQRTDPSDNGSRYDNYGNPNQTRDGSGEEEAGLWSYLQAAGKKLSDAETEVWRRINKE